MSKIKLNEIWKTVKFDFEFTNDFKLEVSNNGRIRSTNKLATERILKGSLINGYRVVILKFFKPRTEKMEKRIAFYKKQFAELHHQMKPLKVKIKTRKIHDNSYLNLQRKLKSLQLLFDTLNKNYRKEFNADLKQRTINCTLLVHRLVAEYFCEKPTDLHNQVIHLNHYRTNNNAGNLKWVTQEELNIHQQSSPYVKAENKKRKGRRIESSKHFKLTSTRVMLIKKRLNEGKSLHKLAKQFKVSHTQIYRIRKGINWSNIKAAN